MHRAGVFPLFLRLQRDRVSAALNLFDSPAIVFETGGTLRS